MSSRAWSCSLCVGPQLHGGPAEPGAACTGLPVVVNVLHPKAFCTPEPPSPLVALAVAFPGIVPRIFL